MTDTKIEYIAANGLTLDLFNDAYFDTTNIDGLTTANATLATTTTPTVDGDTINNIQGNPRTIIFDFKVKTGVDVETCKRHILNVIKWKQKGTLQLTQGTGEEQRIIKIDGVIQTVDMPRFNNNVTMQVVLYCSNSLFEDLNAIVIEISRIIDAHHFPVVFPNGSPIALGVIDQEMQKSYVNDGDAATGVIITITALGNVTNPVISKAGQFIGVNDSLVNGDVVVIDTNKGHKTITKNGVSILNKIKAGSTFIQMETGDNVFVINADSGAGNMYFNITFKRRFV